MTMIVVETSLLIERPCEKVFDFVAAGFFDNLKRFNPALVKIEKLTEGPVGVGTLGREVQRIQGKDVARTFRVAEMDSPRRFVVVNEGHEGVERHYRGQYTFAPDGSGKSGKSATRLDYRFELDWQTPLFRWFTFLPRTFIRRDLLANMQRLRQALEAES